MKSINKVKKIGSPGVKALASSPLLAACDSSVDSTSINKTSEAAAAETTVSSPGKFTSDIVNNSPEENAEEKVQIQFLCTSDIHGKYLPYDYARDAESLSGSMAQVYSAIKENEMKNMILVDVGDSIQDNFANIYIKEPNHPFAQAVKKMGYDIWCLGNHDFNYGLDSLRKVMKQMSTEILCGNVYDEQGERLADSWTILDVDGVKVGIIGMCTPNITRWDAANLAGCRVTNPVDETRAAIHEIGDKCDILVAAVHMSENNEYNVYGSGAADLAEACPELDVILASHGHKLVEGREIAGVLVTENLSAAKSMIEVVLTVIPDGKGKGKYKVTDRKSRAIMIKDYKPDKEITELLDWADKMAKKEAHTVIGQLSGGPLVPENEIKEIPQAIIEETPLINLVNDVQMYYAGTDISATGLYSDSASLQDGEILKCDISRIYEYDNTLYKLQMTGAQLKKWMEWTTSGYKQYQEGDLTISFNADMPVYDYSIFSGVNYEVNIANKPGSRIENLTWPDGRPVKDDDVFEIAANNYQANTNLLTPGTIFKDGEDLPVLLEMDIGVGGIDAVRELIGDYIQNVCDGEIQAPVLKGKWKITGNDWDKEKHL